MKNIKLVINNDKKNESVIIKSDIFNLILIKLVKIIKNIIDIILNAKAVLSPEIRVVENDKIIKRNI